MKFWVDVQLSPRSAATTYLRVFHNSVSVFIRPWREGEYQKALGPSVVCDRLITNGSGSGDPALQGLTRGRYQDLEGSPTASRPGGLS